MGFPPYRPTNAEIVQRRTTNITVQQLVSIPFLEPSKLRSVTFSQKKATHEEIFSPTSPIPSLDDEDLDRIAALLPTGGTKDRSVELVFDEVGTYRVPLSWHTCAKAVREAEQENNDMVDVWELMEKYNVPKAVREVGRPPSEMRTVYGH